MRKSNMRLKTLNVLLLLTYVGTECQFYLLVVPYTQLLKAMQKDYYTKYCNTSKLKTDNKYRLIINKTKKLYRISRNFREDLILALLTRLFSSLKL